MAPFNKTSRGLPQVVLVILLAWALTAVLILTGTLINAREIDRRVVYINSQLAPINQHTGYIALAGKTNVIASKILAATPTLAPGLIKTNNYVVDINKTVTSILKTAKSINTKVLGIGATVATIHGTVGSIHSTVTSIYDDVVNSITPKLARTGKDVTAIGNSVTGIHNDATSILGSVRNIQTNVTDINGKAAATLADVNGGAGTATILPLTVSIDDLVGEVDRATPTPNNSVVGHANSIDCAALFQLLGVTKSCGQAIKK